MPLIYRDRVRETSTTTGTGALELGGAVTGFQSFAAAFDDGATTRICIALRNGAEWEVVEGVYDLASNTVSRDTVIDSSTGPGVLCDFSGGTKDVYCVLDSETINNMFAGTGITELTGDVLAGPGSSTQVATLSATGVVPGIYVNATIEVDSSGRILVAADGVGGGASVTIADTPPGSPAAGDLWWKSDEGRLKIYYEEDSTGDSAQWVDAMPGIGAGAASSSAIAVTNGFRLSLTTAVPVTTSDVTGATTVFAVPYKGNQIGLYDGAAWSVISSAQFSLALGTLTSDKNYDVFCYSNAGIPTLEFLAWSSDTARATALAYQDGILVKSGDATRRYLGTFRTTSTTTTADSGGGSSTQVGGKRFLWNYYHRIERFMAVIDTTTSWAYTTDTWRQANAAAGNKVEFVVGVAEDLLNAHLVAMVSHISSSARWPKVSIALDSTTTPSRFVARTYNQNTSYVDQPMNVNYVDPAPLGYHYLAWIEKGGDGTATFGGSNGGAQGGLSARLNG